MTHKYKPNIVVLCALIVTAVVCVVFFGRFKAGPAWGPDSEVQARSTLSLLASAFFNSKASGEAEKIDSFVAYCVGRRDALAALRQVETYGTLWINLNFVQNPMTETGRLFVVVPNKSTDLQMAIHIDDQLEVGTSHGGNGDSWVNEKVWKQVWPRSK